MRAVPGLSLLLALPALAAPAGQPVRDGVWWVETTTGVIAPEAAGTLRLQTRGPVTAEGDWHATSAHFKLIRKVRASNEAEAKRLLAELAFRTKPGSFVLTSPQRPRAMAELHVRVPARLKQLLIDTHGGDVRVNTMAGGVQVQSGAGPIQMDGIGGQAIARTAGGDIRLGRIGGSVRCFSGGGAITVASTGGESWFETAGGEIHVGESAGAIHASTAGGNIQIGRALNSVAARTSGGRIDVQEANGIVVAGNSGGSISVGAAQGVKLESSGGSIRMRGASGALRAISDVGSILAEIIPGVRLQDSVLSTGAGDITVFLPSDVRLTVQALNESGRSGRIISEFSEIPVRVMEAQGTLNGGGPVLKLTSTGGTIYLRRLQR